MDVSFKAAQYECGICSWVFSPDQPSDALLLPCGHTYCATCLTAHYTSRQTRSTMRIALLPCPQCRQGAAVPCLGVQYFPSPYDVNFRSYADEGNVSFTTSAEDDDVRLYNTKNNDITTTNHTRINDDNDEIGFALHFQNGDVGYVSPVHNGDNRMANMSEEGQQFREPDSDRRTNSAEAFTMSQKNSTDSEGSHVDSPLTGKPEVRFVFPPSPAEDGRWMEGSGSELNSNFRKADHSDKEIQSGEEQMRQKSLDSGDDDCATPTSQYPPPLNSQTSKPISQRAASTYISPEQILESNYNDPFRTTSRNHNRASVQTGQSNNASHSSSELKFEPSTHNLQGTYNHNDNQTSTPISQPSTTPNSSSEHRFEPSSLNLLGTYSPRWQIVKSNHELPISLLILSTDWAQSSLGSEAVIAEYGASRVNFVDHTGEIVTTISGLKPFSLALDPSGYLLIGDRRTKSLLALNRDGEEAYRWEQGCFPWVGGIACMRGGNVVVYDRDWARIGIYSPEGEKIRVFGSYGSTGDDQTCMADFLTVDRYNRIIVSDSANHRVKIFDETGELLTVFGGRGSAEGRLNWPRGVCTNERGEILVVDSMNERVVLFAGSGKYIGTAMDSVERPYGLGYGSGGLVGLTQHRRAGWSQTSLFQVLP